MIIDTTCSVIERKMKEAKENSLAGLVDDDHIQYTLSSFNDVTIQNYTIDTCTVAGGVMFTSDQSIIFDSNVIFNSGWGHVILPKIKPDAQFGFYIQA